MLSDHSPQRGPYIMSLAHRPDVKYDAHGSRRAKPGGREASRYARFCAMGFWVAYSPDQAMGETLGLRRKRGSGPKGSG